MRCFDPVKMPGNLLADNVNGVRFGSHIFETGIGLIVKCEYWVARFEGLPDCLPGFSADCGVGYQHGHRHCGNQIVPDDGSGRGCSPDCLVKWGQGQQPVFFQGCSGWFAQSQSVQAFCRTENDRLNAAQQQIRVFPLHR